MFCTFSFGCFQIYQNKSAKNIAVHFIGTWFMNDPTSFLMFSALLVYQFSTISNKMELQQKLSNQNRHFLLKWKLKFLFGSFWFVGVLDFFEKFIFFWISWTLTGCHISSWLRRRHLMAKTGECYIIKRFLSENPGFSLDSGFFQIFFSISTHGILWWFRETKIYKNFLRIVQYAEAKMACLNIIESAIFASAFCRIVSKQRNLQMHTETVTFLYELLKIGIRTKC